MSNFFQQNVTIRGEKRRIFIFKIVKGDVGGNTGPVKTSNRATKLVVIPKVQSERYLPVAHEKTSSASVENIVSTNATDYEKQVNKLPIRTFSADDAKLFKIPQKVDVCESKIERSMSDREIAKSMEMMPKQLKLKEARFHPLLEKNKLCPSVLASELTERKRLYPVTPMCLKRTNILRSMKRIKTTEEIELEKIAELQKQLSIQLKINQAFLRKLGLKESNGNCVRSKTDHGLNEILERKAAKKAAAEARSRTKSAVPAKFFAEQMQATLASLTQKTGSKAHPTFQLSTSMSSANTPKVPNKKISHNKEEFKENIPLIKRKLSITIV